MAKKRVKSETEPKIDFEASLGQLEQIVRDLEGGEVGLDESLAKYESGVKLLRQCHDLLKRAERRIELLHEVDSDGEPKTSPMEDGPTTLEDKTATRSQRRTAKKPAKAVDDPDDMDMPRSLF